MNILDIVFIVILSVSLVLALFKGFIKEIISLTALVGGLILAAHYYGGVAGLFADWVESPSWRAVLGFLIIFFGVLMAAGVTIFIINRVLKFSRLKWFDRLLGGLFGLIRGGLICTVIVLIMTAFAWKLPVLKESALAPYLMITARIAAYAVPRELHEEFESQYKKVYQHWLDMMEGYKSSIEENHEAPSEPREE